MSPLENPHGSALTDRRGRHEQQAAGPHWRPRCVRRPGLCLSDHSGETGALAAGARLTIMTTSIPEIAGVDRQQVETMLGGDGEMFVELLRGFVGEYGHSASWIEAALARGDRTGAAAHLHKVRGTAGYLGATGIVRTSRQLEDALKAGGNGTSALFADYARCLGELVQAAAPWLATPVR
jgi:HPt (histidine-containing phosphotransfer) domain-containing protein